MHPLDKIPEAYTDVYNVGTYKGLLLYPNPLLRKVAEEVTEFGPELQAQADEMFQIMDDCYFVGLAANQINRDQRLMVLRAWEGNPGIALANPKLIQKMGGCDSEEGCGSLPGLIAIVRRPEIVFATGQNLLTGEEEKHHITGLQAWVFEHELDHLNGIYIADKAIAYYWKGEPITESWQAYQAQKNNVFLRDWKTYQEMLHEDTKDAPWDDWTVEKMSQMNDEDIEAVHKEYARMTNRAVHFLLQAQSICKQSQI